jgi:hypothetical protein
LPFDPEAVVDLGVVAFAEQRRVLQAGLAVVAQPDVAGWRSLGKSLAVAFERVQSRRCRG